MSNKKKAEQLGVSYGAAANRLRKMILFSLVRKLDLDWCHQCENRIENIDNFSIEHKIPWFNSDDPRDLYFDLNNIAFSHTGCNYGAKRYTGNPTTMVSLKCATCGMDFKRELSQVNSKKTIGQKDFYCTPSCSAKARGKGYGRRNYE